ncbi:MAG TPA: adenylosuccinate lyase, partial [Chryseolinea sp.]|nr:adenylosuccinate lyase [Chryseolinea sp.]
MELNPLTAISPIDGRYFETVKPLSPYFSEFALMKYRIQVEIEYLIALSGSVTELDDFPVYRLKDLRGIFKNFTEAKAEEIKEIEKTTNHDVKALEYYIKKEFDS